MQIQENILLSPYTTFRIGGIARFFVFAQNEEEIIAACQHAKENKLDLLILGGGSNMLISDKGFNGLVIRTENIGIDLVEEDDDYVTLKLASGEIWDDVVRFAVEQNWYGIENLSHIPGFCGAFAVQNVGAYGQEASQVIEKIEAYDNETGKTTFINNNECNFGYRTSIFNTISKGRYIILNTYIKLAKHGEPNLSYGDLKKQFENTNPSLRQIREAVINIRNTKFPFPDISTKGNAGSFFRGPILNKTEFKILVEKIKISFGEEASNKLEAMADRLEVPQGFKTPTAFLIELCGLKGYVCGGAKINEPQPAIIINFTGLATFSDVLKLYKHVVEQVKKRTTVVLHMEPELIGYNHSEIMEIA